MPKILVVGNINNNLISLKAFINDAFPGAVVLTALNGSNGIELAISNNPDVILLDAMPGMDGFEVCRLLKLDERVRDIPVVFLTALKGDKENRVKAIEVGAEGFLAKQIDEIELTAQIRAMIKIKAANEQKRDEKERLGMLVDEALTESEEKYSILFKNSPDSYLIISEGIFVDCNKATEIMLRGERTQIIGQSPDELSPEIQPDGKKSSDSAAEKIAFAYENGKNTFEWMHRRFDGSDLYVEVSIAPMKLKGKLTLFTTWRDISARKLAEKALRESEIQFREFFEKAADAIFIADIETGMIVDVNEAATRLMNRSYDQLVGIHQSQLHPPAKENYAKDNFKKHKELVKQKLSSYALENTIIRADGIEVPVEVLAAEVHYHGKRCLMGTFRDITERKKSEKEIQESEAKYRYMFQHNPQPMWIYDHDTLEILEVNNVSTKIYGYSREEFLSMTLKDIRPAEDIPLMLDDVEESRLDENSLGEWRHLKKNGEIMNVEISASSIIFNGRKARHVLIKDITKRKRAEEAIRKSESMLRTLIESAPFEVWARDKDGYGILENENQVRHFGSIIGKTPDHVGIAPQVSRLWNSNNRRVMNGEIVNDECVYPVDGVERTFHQILAPIIVDGSIEGITGFNIDITERKVAEFKLREVNQRFTELVASTDGIVWEADAKTFTFSFISKNAERILGYEIEDWLQPGFWAKHIFEDDRNNTVQFCVDQTNQCSNHDFEYRFVTKDGRTVWLVDFVKVIMENGKPHWLHGLMVDITERKKAEKELADQKQRLADILRGTNAGTWTWNVQTGEVILNDRWAEIIGYNLDELKPISINTWISNVHPDDLTATNEMLNKHLKGEHEYFDVEFRQPHKDGKLIWVNAHGKVIEWTDDGKPLWMSGTHLDITERKLAEKNLYESEDRYRRFISQISEGVYRFECDEPMDVNLPLEEQIDFIYDHMFIAECNDAFQRMYGLRGEKEVLGKSQLDFHGGRNNPLNRSSLREFVNNGYRIEGVITEETNLSNAQLIYFSNNSLGIIEKNQLVRIWGTQTDVTEKIKANQVQHVLFSISNAALSSIDLPKLIEFISKEVGKLLDSTNFYIAFYDEKTDMLSTIYERDEKDVIETWPAENSITGYVIKQQKSLLLKDEDFNQFYHDAGIQAFGTPCKVWLGVPLVTNKKTVGAIVVQSYENPEAYTEKDKQMLEFISHQIGISIERKKTDQELKLLGKAFDQSPVSIVITDKEGNIEYVNPKSSESSGYALDEVKGKNSRAFNSGNQSREYYQELWKTILEGKDWVGEFQNKRKNGELYWESALISPITNEKGEISSFLAIKEDITEKKKMIDDLVHARNKAEESDRLKSSFLANMSHEIRTPLNSIIGFSELLLDADLRAEQYGEFARTINTSGNSLLTIISDIMDISKIEAGQIKLHKKKFSVNKLIDDIQKEYSYKASEKGIELRLNPANPKEEIFIESDEQRIRQVLINFIGNATKFTEKGFVEIGFGIESGRDKASVRDKACLVSTMRFFVKDSGIGIPEEYHQQIFERFRQVETANTRKYGGNGLGLAISKNLVELLGGQIGIDSEKGKGSTFFFTIPL